ncbi:MAG: flagellar basal body P-ring protein FlgI [Pseudomonadota bacterium]
MHKFTYFILAAVLIVGGTLSTTAFAQSRIKDIVDFEHVRDNQLTGYGLVVGLRGTGDILRNAPFTEQSLEAMLERLGVNIRDVQLNTRNVAAVSVTATLPPFAQSGSRIDVQISTLGDATDLMGGTLLVTPLIGLDGEVYAVAQGQVAVNGFSVGGDAAIVARGVSTSGRISNGGIVEREIDFDLRTKRSLKLSLRNPDFTTAERVSAAINSEFGALIAETLDPATVQVITPVAFQGNIITLLSRIEQLPIQPDQIARVIIDESSGIIVMGANVKISTVAIAQGNLTIRITEQPQVSQPAPFSEGGETVVVPRTDVAVDAGDDQRLTVVDGGVDLQQLVDGLNALGVGPRDLISILQALKASGAMQAELEVI